jgi:hypothetical protein
VPLAQRQAAHSPTSKSKALMSFNKLGPHSQLRSEPARQWSSVAARIVKQMDGTDMLAAAPPGAITIYRRYFGSQDINSNGMYAANDIIANLRGFRPSYVELFNETSQRLGQGLERHVEWTKEACAVLHANGLYVAGFSFSTGNPGAGYEDDTPDWEYLQAHNYGDVDAISMHCYWGNQGFTEGHALRYRRGHRITNGNHPPFIISETGRDAIEGGQGGWVRDGKSPEEYLDELSQYNELISQDEYVLGATPFTCAPSSMWTAVDMDTLVPTILGTGPPPGPNPPMPPNPPYPPEPPTPSPQPGSPWALIIGLGIGAIGAGVLLAEYLGYEPSLELIVRDVRELEPGQPIPPGYIVLEQ